MTTNKAADTEQIDFFADLFIQGMRRREQQLGLHKNFSKVMARELVMALSGYFKKVDPEALKAFAEEIG